MPRLYSPSYLQFLASPEWQAIRREALKGAGFRCERCWITKHEAGWLEVNHKHYQRPFGTERWPDDLEVLCATCHREADHERRERNVRRQHIPAWQLMAAILVLALSLVPVLARFGPG